MFVWQMPNYLFQKQKLLLMKRSIKTKFLKGVPEALCKKLFQNAENIAKISPVLKISIL